MEKQAGFIQNSQSKAIANIQRQQTETSAGTRLADNRHEAIMQRRLKALANRTAQLESLPIQKQSDLEEEKPVQGKFETLQRVASEDEELLQGKFAQSSTIQLQTEAPNNTGLPNQLKAGIESLGGMSMDHVKVHYNSDKPAQLNAHGYTQGGDIHVAPGQEKHLPHEAWHVVQQKQGRVQPTRQIKECEPVQLKWIDNGGQYLVWDTFLGRARWYFNKKTGKMFYRQADAGKGNGTQSEEKTREEWLADSDGVDLLKNEDASVITPLNYQEARNRGNKENRDKKIVVSVSNKWGEAADSALFEIGNQWIAFGGDPMKETKDHECSGKDWNTLDEGADVSHDMFQPSYRNPASALNGKQWVYMAHYEGEMEQIAVMILEVRQHKSVQENQPYMYLRWMVAHPSKGGGAAVLMKIAIAEAAQTTSNALRVESARSAVSWYEKQGLILFKAATHETNEACGCGEMGTVGKYQDKDSDDSDTD